MRSTSHRSWTIGCLGLVAVAVLVAPVRVVSAQSDKPRVYALVTDSRGKPVKGLGKDDFTVKLDGKDQEVLSARPATEPASIVILTDRLGIVSTYPAYEAHTALAMFVKGIRTAIPDSKIALATFDGTVITMNTFASGPAELDRNLGKLTSVAPDAVLLDGLYEVGKILRTAPTARKVVFAVVAAYRPDQSNFRNDILAEVLRLSGAQLWVVEVRSAQGGNYSNNQRDQLLDRGTFLSGGTLNTVASPSGLESACRQVPELLAAQYELTYGPGGGAATSQLAVGVKQTGLKVIAPIWTDR
jgi:hypothetical protein